MKTEDDHPKNPTRFIPSGKEISTMFHIDNSSTQSLIENVDPNKCGGTHIVKDATVKRSYRRKKS